MSDEARIDELLLRWEERRGQGQTLSAEELCRDSPDLLPTVRWRIRALEAMDAMLGPTTGIDPATPADAGGAGPEPSPPVAVLSTRSTYRVLGLYARGGLGEVLLARDEELCREVALKRMRHQARHDPQRRRRFLREAEVTSRLEHPGIVPVYGLGEDGAGHPCYAMRFIRGDTLHDAIRRLHAPSGPAGGLTLRQLLGRFVLVCNAVAYAHSKGVIHRDLKPANILLGPYGEALVVDWGLARQVGEVGPDDPAGALLGADGPETGTRTGAVLGTPAFMSPEQAAGDTARVGPGSDVFSLGATLYALLTGRAPFDGSDALVRARRGDFPPPRRQKKGVPAALEAICLKAMAPRPEGRYATALDLAADLDRWLADEPVSVFRDPWRVRSGRWVRRHQTAVASAAVLLITAVVALATGIVLVGKAQADTRRALKQSQDNEIEARANFRMAREAVDHFCTRVSEERLLNEPGMKGLRKELLEDAQDFYRRLVRQPSSDTEVRAEQGRAHLRLALISAQISSRDEAIQQCEEARHVFEDLSRTEPAVASYRFQLANTLLQLSVSYRDTGRRDEAERAGREAGDLSRDLLRAEADNADYRHQLAESCYQLGVLYNKQGRRDEAEAAFREALALQEESVRAEPANAEWQEDVARTWNLVGTLHHSAGRLGPAEEAWRKSLETWERIDADHPNTPRYQSGLAQAWNNVGVLARLQNRPERTEAAWRKALALREQLANDHPSSSHYQEGLADSLSNLGVLFYEAGRYDEAEAEYRKALAVQEKLTRNFPTVIHYQQLPADTWNNLGELNQSRGRPKPAEEALRAALAIYERLATEHADELEFAINVGSAHYNLGNFLRRNGRAQDALDCYARARTALETVLRKDGKHAEARRSLCDVHAGRARALGVLGRHEEAGGDWDRALELADGADRDPVRAGRADALAHAGRHRAAAEEADALADGSSVSGPVLYDLACVFALCSTAAGKDAGLAADDRTALAERHAARAVALLARSHANGYLRRPAEVEHMRKDSDLDPLRSRADFQKVVAGLGE